MASVSNDESSSSSHPVESYNYDPNSPTCPVYLKDISQGCTTYRAQKGRGNSSGRKIVHYIVFMHDTFTLHGSHFRKVDDPQNASFLKSLEKSQVPEEFDDGMHEINIKRLVPLHLKEEGRKGSQNNVIHPGLWEYSDEGTSGSDDSDNDLSE